MRKVFFTLAALVTGAVSVMAQCPPNTATATVTLKRKIAGALDGNFTVNSSGKKVIFSQGNLKYTKSTGKFAFMTNQYDVVETNSQNVGADYASQDVITLFGWGTSGWDNTSSDATSVHYQPYATCKTDHKDYNNSYQYGPSNVNVVGDDYTVTSAESWLKSDAYKNYDWGVYNSGDLGSTGWFTLEGQEWKYLFDTRTPGNSVNGRSNARYTEATINTDGTSVNGIILFPDDASLTTVSGVTWGYINIGADWFGTEITKCTTDGWKKLEEAGCVFLPAAGYRDETTVWSADYVGYYWSSSPGDGAVAYHVSITSGSVNPAMSNRRHFGMCVRLVHLAE